MSIDYDFWRYKSGITHDDQRIYEQLSDGETLEVLQELPIESIRLRIRTVFSDWNWLNENSCEHKTGSGSFTLFTTQQLVRFDCYGMFQGDINRFLDVLTQEFECPLYDPQISVRFDSWTDV